MKQGKGFFITLEGADGSGKTTQGRRLAETLRQEGWTVLETREPGGTPVSEGIRALLLDPRYTMGEMTEALLYEAARAQLVQEVIKPALAEGTIVLCDRYTDSTLAYQGYGRGLDKAWLAEANHLATAGLKPYRTLLFDVSPETGAFRRRQSRGQAEDRLEQEAFDFHQRVRQGYLELAKEEPERIVIIDGEASLDEVFGQAWQALKGLLEKG